MTIRELLDAAKNAKTIVTVRSDQDQTTQFYTSRYSGNDDFFLEVSDCDSCWSDVWFDPDCLHGADPEELLDVMSAARRFLDTPLNERKEKKYLLVLDRSSLGPLVLGIKLGFWLGVSRPEWGIDNKAYLESRGYQTVFTDSDLKEIASGDQDMLDRLTVLKREAPDNA